MRLGAHHRAARHDPEHQQKRPERLREQPPIAEPWILKLLTGAELEREPVPSALLVSLAEGYRLLGVHLGGGQCSTCLRRGPGDRGRSQQASRLRQNRLAASVNALV